MREQKSTFKNKTKQNVPTFKYNFKYLLSIYTVILFDQDAEFTQIKTNLKINGDYNFLLWLLDFLSRNKNLGRLKSELTLVIPSRDRKSVV